MNPSLLHALAGFRVREIHHDASDRHLASQARLPHSPSPAQRRGTGMRMRVGYTLVEAGLRLVATSGPND